MMHARPREVKRTFRKRPTRFPRGNAESKRAQTKTRSRAGTRFCFFGDRKSPRIPFRETFRAGSDAAQYMPPMPPSGIAGAAFGSSGTSVMRHSVVSSIEATEVAETIAVRVTFAGSTTPAATRSS